MYRKDREQRNRNIRDRRIKDLNSKRIIRNRKLNKDSVLYKRGRKGTGNMQDRRVNNLNSKWKQESKAL